jgi:hypothetical protein
MRVLLDENVPVDILPVLRNSGTDAESVNLLGWKGIQNGDLIVRARVQFDLLLTRDKDFDEAYLRQLITNTFGIVLPAIPQQPGAGCAESFARLWPSNQVRGFASNDAHQAYARNAYAWLISRHASGVRRSREVAFCARSNPKIPRQKKTLLLALQAGAMICRRFELLNSMVGKVLARGRDSLCSRR